MNAVWEAIYARFFAHLPYPSHPFTGQTIIITGSNTGLGLEAARHFVRLSASRVILAVRSPSKGESAKTSIEASTGRKDVVEVWPLDLTSPDSIQAFSLRAAGLPRLDVLVANAGIMTREFALAESGHETTVATNVLGTFLLALNLLPVLRASSQRHNTQAKLVVLSSAAHLLSRFPEAEEADIYAALSDPKKAAMLFRYNLSKLLDVLLARELAEKVTASAAQGKTPVIVSSLDPGLADSELFREVTGIEGYFMGIGQWVFGRTTEQGSRTIVWSVEQGEEVHGKYLANCRVQEPSGYVRSEKGAKAQKKLWEQTMTVLEGLQPGVTKNI